MQGTAFAIAATTPDLGWMDSLRRRRAERRAHRALERELSAYTTRSEIQDLLIALDRHDAAERDEVRDILLRNLQRARSTRLAS